jgi:hypothetical protein
LANCMQLLQDDHLPTFAWEMYILEHEGARAVLYNNFLMWIQQRKVWTL